MENQKKRKGFGMKRNRIIQKLYSYLCIAVLVTSLVSHGNGMQVKAESYDEQTSINDNTISMKGSNYAFDQSYIVPGDELTVNGAEGNPTSETVNWTVKKLVETSSSGEPRYRTIATTTGNPLSISADYLECMVYAEVNGEKLTIYCSETPVIYMNTENSIDLYSYNQSDYEAAFGDGYINAQMNLVGNEEFTNTAQWYNGKAEIKLRGNSTKYRPKRPFKVKLGKKTDLLGLGTEDDGTSYKSKHWVLLANDIDHTLVRNKLLYDFSGDIGTEYYFKSTNVSLIYNGEYQGVYQLCEHRRVDEGRIDITNWTSIGEEAASTIAAAQGLDANQTDALTSALENVMATNFSWIDNKEVTYNGATYSFADYGITLPKTNGGFLGEMDFYSISGDTTTYRSTSTLAGLMTAYSQPLYFSAPEPGENVTDYTAKQNVVNSFKDTSLYNHANQYTQTFEYALHSDDFFFRNEDDHYKAEMQHSGRWFLNQYSKVDYNDDENTNKHYSQLFDMDSLVTNFIFCEYAMNWDSMKNSFFYYKDVDQLAKIGPQWDFDWSWGNKNMFGIYTWYPTDWHTTINAFTVEQYYQTVQWNRMLIRDPYFVTKAYEKYHEIRNTYIEDMIKAGGLIDQYYEYLRDAGAANDARWSYTYGSYGSVNYEESYTNLKNFVNTRVTWLDQQFTSVEKLIESLGYYKTSSKIEAAAYKGENTTTLAANVKDANIHQVVFQINGTIQQTAAVSNGSASVVIENSSLSSSSFNTVHALAVNASGDYIYNTAASKTGNYNVVVSDYEVFDINNYVPLDSVTLNQQTHQMYVGETLQLTADVLPQNASNPLLNWKTSNDSVAIVSNSGFVTATGAGTVTITAESKADASKKAECTIQIQELPIVKISICLNRDVHTLDIGGKVQLTATITPKDASYQSVEWKTSNASVASVSNSGLVTAKKAGVADITVISQYDSSQTAKCTITVRLDAPKLTVKGSTGNIKVAWNKVSNAKKYDIYRKLSSSKTYSKVYTTTKTSYTDNKAKAGKKYDYKIVALHDTGSCDSSFSNVVTVKIPVKAKVKVKSNSAKKATITWGKVKDVSGYVIYRSTKKNGGYKAIKTIKTAGTTKYTDKNLTSRKNYYYKVRAYKKTGKVKVFAKDSKPVKVKIK